MGVRGMTRASRWLRVVIACVLSAIAMPALAWSQCPPEAGEKSNSFMAMGWSLLALSVAAGLWLMWAVDRHTRAWRLRRRLPALVGGLVAMLAVWLAGLVFVFRQFVLTC